jgi:guanylate kinase
MDAEAFKAKLQELIPYYRPNPAVKSQLSEIIMLAVVGPTSVGKTTLIESTGLPMIVSDASRAPRRGEIDGVDNFFRSDFDAVIREIEAGEYVQIAFGSEGDFKGTKISRYPQSGVVAMPVTSAALPVFYSLGFKKVIPAYIVPPSFDEWRRRMQARRSQESDELFMNRLKEAARSLTDALNDDRYKFVINDDLNTAKSDILSISTEQYDAQKNAQAREIAVSIKLQLQKLDSL